MTTDSAVRIAASEMYRELPATETVLWAVRIGAEDWEEEIITTNAAQIEAAKLWATANGFNRFRVATINLTEKPDFTRTIGR